MSCYFGGIERYLQIDPKSSLQGCCRGSVDLDQRSAIYTAAGVEARLPHVAGIQPGRSVEIFSMEVESVFDR